MMNKLFIKMVQADYEDFDIRRIKELVTELQSCGVQGIDAFVRILSERVATRQEYLDITKEGRFARILSRNGFSQIHIEYSSKGPDVKADYNHQTVYFEVTRRRPNEEDDNWEKSEAGFVASNSAQDIISKIGGELSHFSYGEINIVVYWSSTIQVRHIDVRDAFTYIRQEIEADPKRYQKLSGVLFTEEEGINMSMQKQYYLFKNDEASRPIGVRLARKLESLHTEDPKVLARR
ncbi:MAG TPA: hypothetical protein VMX96_06895 [Dehalococcoidia bacterium]|nr:hypothetical protein [Dehalococcoidia bacterium]